MLFRRLLYSLFLIVLPVLSASLEALYGYLGYALLLLSYADSV